MTPIEAAVGGLPYEWWDLVPAVVGGIIGALAGGIPAWLLAKRQSDETLRRDQEQRTQNHKALAFSAAVKLLHIINSTISLSNHVMSCMSLRDHPERARMEPWQVLVPMIGHTDEIQYDSLPKRWPFSRRLASTT